MKQTPNQRNRSRNRSGTFSLKALANKVMERNNKENNPGTTASKSVPSIPQNSSACGTNSEVSVPSYGIEQKPSFDPIKSHELLNSFEERLAIAEYDGQQSSTEAERIAYVDAFITILSSLTEEGHHQDWLSKKIQIALAILEEKNFPTLN